MLRSSLDETIDFDSHHVSSVKAFTEHFLIRERGVVTSMSQVAFPPNDMYNTSSSWHVLLCMPQAKLKFYFIPIVLMLFYES